MMGSSEREALKALVKQSPTPIALKQAVKIPNKFELRIVPLSWLRCPAVRWAKRGFRLFESTLQK